LIYCGHNDLLLTLLYLTAVKISCGNQGQPVCASRPIGNKFVDGMTLGNPG
jgi:hypothetical protein